MEGGDSKRVRQRKYAYHGLELGDDHDKRLRTYVTARSSAAFQVNTFCHGPGLRSLWMNFDNAPAQ